MKLITILIVVAMTASLSLSVFADSGRNELFSEPRVEGFWLVDDESLVIEITGCEAGSTSLCGFVRALPGITKTPELADYADELCGLPLLYELDYNADKDRWDGGEIFDPETEQVYDLYIKVENQSLKVRAYEGREWAGETFVWTRAARSDLGCKPASTKGGQ